MSSRTTIRPIRLSRASASSEPTRTRSAPRNEVSSISRTPARRRATSTRRIASSGRKGRAGRSATRAPKRMNVRPAADAASAIRITRPPLRRDGA